MSDFSFWVILSNLLLATRWTILLSLIAFVSGGIVALILLFARVSGKPWLERLTRWYIEFFQGTPLLDAAVPVLLRARARTASMSIPGSRPGWRSRSGPRPS